MMVNATVDAATAAVQTSIKQNATAATVQRQKKNELIHRGWHFTAYTAPISSAKDIDDALNRLDMHAREVGKQALHVLPEMYFGNNSVNVSMPGRFQLSFTALDALLTVQVGRDAPRWQEVKVLAATAWQKKLEEQQAKHTINPSSLSEESSSSFNVLPQLISITAKPYDWTFTAAYMGTCNTAPADNTGSTLPVAIIPIDKIRRKEAILFYEDVVLYEDELADNGVSKLSVKIRVMPSGFFILSRLFCRVDGVLFTLNDTRLYHDFDTDYVVREYTSHSQDYTSVRDAAIQYQISQRGSYMPSTRLSLLTSETPTIDVSPLLLDANWVNEVMCGRQQSQDSETRTPSELIRHIIRVM